MKLHTTNFGLIEIDEEKIINFPEGLLGFEDEKQFIIINSEDEDSLFQWLQSVNNQELAFVIINPFFVFPDYDIIIPETAQNKLKIKDKQDIGVYTIVVVPEDMEKMTTNLLGPIIINIKEKLGKQVILDDDRYTTKHYVFNQSVEGRGE
ncbi:flagellar assembly protein FliW [Schnuerera sp. xch1]|uniref:flagellar assembly protein FliW n=1 Tax=Schnuerera sp. xch1 TaxID=2874283 RepID=UPI001CBC9E1B|nr:flagellar assembly protein FliW [Schnuerera sp. xch1]MBZ2174824.1 flagellar assembly protein FliW [Schnuerera sp. xch1]